MIAAQLEGRRFPTEDGEAYVVGPTVWSDAYVNVLVGDQVTARRVSDVLRYFEYERAPDSPPLPPSSGPPNRQSAEARHGAVPGPEGGMMAVAEKSRAKAKRSALSGRSKTALRKHLLERITIPDHAWNERFGAPERQKGETREAYIKRVLA